MAYRTIKFRGKTGLGEWIYGSLVELNGETYIWQNDSHTHVAQGIIPVQSDTVGQFIGLCDMTGKEIYEGDIVNDIDGKTYLLKNRDYVFYCVANGRWYRLYDIIDDAFTDVIGNIHDNPELLN